MPEPIDPKPTRKLDQAHPAALTERAPAPVRDYRASLFQLGLILVAGAFAVLTFLVKTTPAFAIDLQITRIIQANQLPGFAGLMNAISWPGFSPQAAVITAFISILLSGLGLHWEAVMALLAASVSAGITLLLKNLVQRARPTAGSVNVIESLNSYSFPSGHVIYYLVFLGLLGFLVFSLLQPSPKRSLLLILIGIPLSLIGVSRIYLGEHWASDVLGSYLLGSLILVATLQIYRWGKTRFFLPQPMAKTESQPALRD